MLDEREVSEHNLFNDTGELIGDEISTQKRNASTDERNKLRSNVRDGGH